MIKKTQILMSDQVDKHNEKMPLSTLESAKDQTNVNIISSHKNS